MKRRFFLSGCLLRSAALAAGSRVLTAMPAALMLLMASRSGKARVADSTDPVEGPAQPAPSARSAPPDIQPLLKHYGAMAHAVCLDTLAALQTMQQAIDTFVARPSAARLEAARRQWLQARDVFVQSEAFDWAGSAGLDTEVLARINPWPIDEAQIDYVDGDSETGLVNDGTTPMTADELAQLATEQGEASSLTGWHAIEFLLWGQDVDETGPGRRSHEDFVPDRRALQHADRRGAYLKAVTALLVSDLNQWAAAWAPGVGGNARSALETGGTAALARIIESLRRLSQEGLADAQLDAPLGTQDQEDEQSGFADSSHRDVAGTVLGIRNIWLGRYRQAGGSLLKGASLVDWVEQQDKALAVDVSARIDRSLRLARGMPSPLDRVLLADDDDPDRRKVLQLVESLQLQARLLEKVAALVPDGA